MIEICDNNPVIDGIAIPIDLNRFIAPELEDALKYYPSYLRHGGRQPIQPYILCVVKAYAKFEKQHNRKVDEDDILRQLLRHIGMSALSALFQQGTDLLREIQQPLLSCAHCGRMDCVCPKPEVHPRLFAVLETLKFIQASIAGSVYTFEAEIRGDVVLMSAVYSEPCVASGDPTVQRTRKWFISDHATESEIVQTALKCVLTSAEHRVREHFLYGGARLYGPHMNVHKLLELVHGQDPLDRREEPNGTKY